MVRIGHLEIIEDKREGSDELFYLVKNTSSGRYVRLGSSETGYLMERLSGPALEGSRYSNKIPERLRKVLDEKFEQWGFIGDQSHPEDKSKKHLDLTKIKLVELNVEKVIDTVYPIYSKFFTKTAAVIFIIMAAACIGITAYSVINAFSYGGSNMSGFTLTFTLSDIIITIVLLLVSLAAHELAHAVVCKKYGGTIRSMGILLFFLIPCVYCDVTDVYKIKNRKQRGKVALAGVYINSFLGTGALLAAFILTYAGIIVIPLYYFAISSILVSLYNLIPLVKLDGYWFLSALLDITNLMDKGVLMAYATFFNREKIDSLKVSSARRRGLAVLGLQYLYYKYKITSDG